MFARGRLQPLFFKLKISAPLPDVSSSVGELLTQKLCQGGQTPALKKLISGNSNDFASVMFFPVARLAAALAMASAAWSFI